MKQQKSLNNIARTHYLIYKHFYKNILIFQKIEQEACQKLIIIFNIIGTSGHIICFSM